MEKQHEYVLRGPKKWILLIALLGLALLVFLLWQEGIFLAPWNSKTICSDLDGDGREETLELNGRRLAVLRDGQEIWATEQQWKAEDFLLGDMNRDGRDELLILVWRRGSYGSARPFWVGQDELGYSQHIFIYQWEAGGLKPLWMSSRLQPEVREWKFSGNGTLQIVTASGEDTVWGWQTWGLQRLDGAKIPY